MPKVYLYETDRFQLYRDKSVEWIIDEDEDGLEVSDELLEELEKVQKEFDAVQKKLYNLRKEQKGY